MNKNNKRKCCRNKRNVPAAGLKENNIDFDYDKFAEAIIKAENKITEEKIRKQKEEDDEFKKQLKKELGIDSKKRNFLCEFFYNIKIINNIIKYKKQNKEIKLIFIFFSLVNSFLFFIYSLFFKGLIFTPIILFFIFKKSSILWLLFLSPLFYYLGQIMKLSQPEVEEITNKSTVITIFNSLVAFTAMIFTLITIIITIILN